MKTKTLCTALLIVLSITTSCDKDFEEINRDPNGFTTASDGSLFNGIIQSLVLTGNEQFYIYNEILYKQTQLASLTNEAWGNASIGIEDLWGNYYGTLTEIRELEERLKDPDADTLGLANKRAMLMIVRAYKTFKTTDLFGDMPYSEAGYGFQNLNSLHPKYDTQRDIYLMLLDDLKWADEHIDPTVDGEPYNTFCTFDLLFRGDMKKWRKFANSIRLRQAMRIAEKEPQLAGQVIREIIEGNKPVFEGYGLGGPVLESACLWPYLTGFKNTSLNWSFREHKNLRMGSNIWHLLSASDSTNGSGIFDPRAYIFFEGNKDNQWVAYPQLPSGSTPASGGVPYGEHRDDESNFNAKGECAYSPFNYFIIRDEDNMPIPLITGAEIHFLKAEAYLRGIGVAADENMAGAEYMNGINASVDWWKMVANNLRLPLSGIRFPDKFTIPVNVNAATVLGVYGMWNATSQEEMLRFIYTQLYIDLFRQPWEAYSLARRTGKTPREGEPLQHFRLPYPQSEMTYNAANLAEALQRQGGDDSGRRLWWMP